MTTVNTAQHRTAIKLADGMGLRTFHLDPLADGSAVMTFRDGRIEGRWVLTPEGHIA